MENNINSAFNINNSDNNQTESNKNKLRPCCACKETKEIRDNCIFNKGEESCFKFIEDHKKCLRDMGFSVE